MTVLNIDGRRVTVEDQFLQLSPEQQNATVQEIAASLAPKAEAAPTLDGPGNSLSGVAKSLSVGAAEGAIGLAGLPADAADLATRGFDYLAGTKSNESVAPFAEKYGAGGLTKMVEGYTGEFRKPQTETEKVFRTVGSFLPAAVGGPAGLAGRAVTRAVIPGLASEAAGQLTEGTGYDPVARIAGALGGVVAGNRLGAAMNRPRQAAVSTRPEIDAARTALYNNPNVLALELDNAAMPGLVQRLRTGLDRGTLEPNAPRLPEFLAPQAHRTIGLLEQAAGPTTRVAEIDGVRKILGEMATERGVNFRATPNALAARQLVRSIDDYMANIPQANVVRGDAAAASQALTLARGNAAAEFRSAKVQRAIQEAQNAAASTHSGGNLENAIYQKIRTWLNAPERHLQGWNAAEQAALRDVLPGTGARVTRRVAKLLGGGGGLGQLASGAAGASMFGFPGAVALPAAGMALNRAGSAYAMSRINGLDQLLRSRAPINGPGAQQAILQRMQGGGILGSLPPAQQAALQALLAARGQPVN